MDSIAHLSRADTGRIPSVQGLSDAPTYVFRALRGGNIPRGAALSLVLLAGMTPLVAVYFVWGRRRLDIGQ